MIDEAELGKRLRVTRVKVGLTQGQVAAELGVSRGAVSQIEIGMRAPNSLQLVRLAELYGRDPSELLADEFDLERADQPISSVQTDAAPARGGFSRTPKMSGLIGDDLRRQIIRGELRDGDALPSEAELMARYGVSRPTLREALRILESESLLSVSRGARGGMHVVAPSERMVARYVAWFLEFQQVPMIDVHEAMMAIELPAVEQLAKTGTQADFDALRAQLDIERATEAEWLSAISAGTDFHRLLVDRAGNRTLATMHRTIEEIVLASGAEIGRASGQQDLRHETDSFHAVHRKVLDLITAHQAEEASMLWRRHLRAKIKVLRQMQERTAPVTSPQYSLGLVSR